MRGDREMHSMWVSLKENVSCGSKQIDVVRQSENNMKNGKYICKKKSSESKLIHGVNNPICRKQDMQKQYYYELKLGDPSRSIIEMVFQTAALNPKKQSGRIKRVLKVNNSLETLERFEKYREMVKKKAYCEEKSKRHPRSMVDGNELLRFYGTTMTCCCQGKLNWVSEFCKETTCGVCRMIQSEFNTERTKKNGIRMSSSSEGLSDTVTANSKRKSSTRAVIVCRIIAGSERWNEIDYLILQNPSAVLPCFVIVFT